MGFPLSIQMDMESMICRPIPGAIQPKREQSIIMEIKEIVLQAGGLAQEIKKKESRKKVGNMTK